MKEAYKEAFEYIVFQAPIEDKPVLKEFLEAIYMEDLTLVGMLFIRYDQVQRAVLKKHSQSVLGAAKQTNIPEMEASVKRKLELIDSPANRTNQEQNEDYLTNAPKPISNMANAAIDGSVDITDLPKLTFTLMDDDDDNFAKKNKK